MIPNPLCAPCLAMLAKDLLPLEDVRGFQSPRTSFHDKLEWAIESVQNYPYVKTPDGTRMGIIPRTIIDNTLYCAYHAQFYFWQKNGRGAL